MLNMAKRLALPYSKKLENIELLTDFKNILKKKKKKFNSMQRLNLFRIILIDSAQQNQSHLIKNKIS